MQTLPNKITTAHVWTEGDASVGISGEGAEVKATGDYLIDLDTLAQEDRVQTLEAFRTKTAGAFGAIWDELVKVLFDFELTED